MIFRIVCAGNGLIINNFNQCPDYQWNAIINNVENRIMLYRNYGITLSISRLL